MSKFAPMTASLLVRKGGAAPSQVPGLNAVATFPAALPHCAPVRDYASSPLAAKHRMRLAADHAPLPEAANSDGEVLRRIMICVRPCELERLEIAAIKTGVNRHEIARKAIDVYLRAVAEELPGHCDCVSGTCGK